MTYFVYVLFSETADEYYKGFSSDIHRRLFEHNHHLSRHTAGKGPWKLVFIRKQDTKASAMMEERRVKRLNRRSLELMIKSDLNELSDFYANHQAG